MIICGRAKGFVVKGAVNELEKFVQEIQSRCEEGKKYKICDTEIHKVVIQNLCSGADTSYVCVYDGVLRFHKEK